MGKRNWPDHPGIGRTITFNGAAVEVVDVKSGPMLFDTSSMDQPEANITGTLKLRVKYAGGHEAWIPPVDGQAFVNWCEKQDLKDKTP